MSGSLSKASQSRSKAVAPSDIGNPGHQKRSGYARQVSMAIQRSPSSSILRPGIWALPPPPMGFPFPPPFPLGSQSFQFPGGNSGFFHVPHVPSVSQTFASLSTDVPSASMNSRLDFDDRQWVKQWVEGKGKQPQSRNASEGRDQDIKLADAKELLEQAFELLGLLQQLHDEMSLDIQMTDVDWEENVARATSVKQSLTSVQAQLSDPEVQTALQAQIVKKRKRRMRLKQRKRRKWEEEQQSSTKSQQVHQEIDEWRAKLIAGDIASKRESELRLEAGETLSEVKAKQRETDKMKQLLESLKELRTHRLESARKRGEEHGEESKVFQQRVEKLESLIERQMESYRSEEKTLKTLMEEEGEAVEQEQLKLVREVTKREEETLETQGDAVAPHGHDPMKEFVEYYCQADHFLDSFIGIRHAWDAFVVRSGSTVGSRIPDGWVEAVEPSSTAWEQYLSSDKPKSINEDKDIND